MSSADVSSQLNYSGTFGVTAVPRLETHARNPET
jgi:hypothetical protein